jgi:phage tail sheath protein FI
MDYLYDNDINPNRFYPGKGIMIWGQKTLYGTPSALDRLNTRLLLIVLEPAVAEALESFLWELNDESTRAIAKNMVDNYMEGIKARRGVYDFYTVCDESNNLATDIENHIMNLHLYVKPTISLEYIPYTTILTPYGMTFTLAQSAI